MSDRPNDIDLNLLVSLHLSHRHGWPDNPHLETDSQHLHGARIVLDDLLGELAQATTDDPGDAVKRRLHDHLRPHLTAARDLLDEIADRLDLERQGVRLRMLRSHLTDYIGEGPVDPPEGQT